MIGQGQRGWELGIRGAAARAWRGWILAGAALLGLAGAPGIAASNAGVSRQSAPREVVFIDGAVGDGASLIPALRPGAEAVVLDPARDAWSQVEAALGGRRGLRAVHLVSHGEPGALRLGARRLDAGALDTLDFGPWRRALVPGAAVLLYGCDVARGSEGEHFIQRFSAKAGAPVAASDGPTGAATLGGNWVLEKATGPIAAAPAFAGTPGYAGLLGTKTFDFTGASGRTQTVGGVTVTVDSLDLSKNSINSVNIVSGVASDTSNGATYLVFTFSSAIVVNQIQVGFTGNSGTAGGFTITGTDGTSTYTHSVQPTYAQMFSSNWLSPAYTANLAGDGAWGSKKVTSITVRNLGGGTVSYVADNIVFVAPPAVTGVSPSIGTTAGGTPVVLTGSGFTGATAVMFGTHAATGVTVVSDTQVNATSPAGTAGSVDVQILTPSGNTILNPSDTFNYVHPPVINSLSPAANITYTGAKLVANVDDQSDDTTVTFFYGPTAAYGSGSVEADEGLLWAGSGSSDMSTTLANLACGATYHYKVVASNAGGSASSGDMTFTTQACPPAPTVTGLLPTSGPAAGGTMVTVTGTDLGSASSVRFGTTSASSFTVVSNTQLQAVAPARSAGTVDVTVTTPGGTSATGTVDQFTYLPAPTVTSVLPSAGPIGGGTSIVLTGTNLTGATAVKFGTTAATTFNVNSATQITATAPAHAVGTVDITVTTPGGTSATGSTDRYTFAAVPAVTAASVHAGPLAGGTTVTLTGTAFTGATAVKFGSTDAVSFTVNSATQIIATAPAGIAGTVHITVTTPGGTSIAGASDQFTYTPAPAVISLNPSAGPLAAGTTVVLTGTDFIGATAVKFANIAATGFTVNSATQITAMAPAGSAGTVDVTVTTAGGTSATSSGDQYTYVAAPTVTGVSPSAGPLAAGQTVLIDGTNFSAATAVKFGTTAASGFTILSATRIQATAPAGSAGTVDITVVSPGGTSATSAADRYAFTAAPTVTGLSPASGPLTGGQTVILAGTNLLGATAVNFGATSAVPTAVSATQLTVTAPPGSAGAVDVTVVTPGGTSTTSASDQYTYVPAPVVSALSTAAGPLSGGTSVILTGSNLLGATVVMFGDNSATYMTVNSASQITAVTPAGTAGAVHVTVTTSGGTSVAGTSDQFLYVAAPALLSLAPTLGPLGGGQGVVITGSNLSLVSGVKFGTQDATFSVNSATQITATAPAGSVGTVDVRLTSPGGVSAIASQDRFTYVAAPTVTSLSSTTGPLSGGQTVTLTGTALTGATAVTFAGRAANPFTVISSTQISVTVPAGGVGAADIAVTTPGGTSAGGPQYTYVAAPALTSLAPASGPLAAGRTVVLTGTNLTAATAVKFGTVDATTFTVNSDTRITATAPGGSAGAVDVTVTTAGGISAAGTSYTFVAPPAVTGIAPASGPLQGGQSVTVTGTNLAAATAVRFGTAEATAFTVNSATQITATAPGGASGTVDITVITVGGTSPASSADRYAYVPAPVVSGISPTAGPLAGGTSVVLTGSNLTGATSVKFGALAAPSFTVDSDTRITATAPAGAAGAVDITVTTVGGASAASASDRFTYLAAPAVSALAPSAGSASGGTEVVLSGANLAGATSVKFGTRQATAFTVTSSTQISATAPAGDPGSVDVTVTTPGGTSATGAQGRFTYATVPGAPTSVTAAAGHGTATVSFAAPASDGGLAIIRYTVTASTGGFTASGASSPLTVTGLAEGTAYTFTVTATNPIGTGSASAPSNSVVASYSVPGAPAITRASAGLAKATVSFTVPSEDGGTPVIGYTVTSAPGGLTATGTSSPLTVAGLTNGVAYTFTVTAANAKGTGTASAASGYVIPGPGGQVLLVHDSAWPLDADMLDHVARRCVDGNNLTATAVETLPAILTGFDQIWDLRSGASLAAADQAGYATYLREGGLLLLAGASEATSVRNASLVQFLSTVGGGDLTLAQAGNIQQVRAPFTGPEPLALLALTGASGPAGAGTWASITDDGTTSSALLWAPGTLRQAPAGGLVTVFNADVFQSFADASGQAFLDNLLGGLAWVARTSPGVTAVSTPTPGNYGPGEQLGFTVQFAAPVTVTGVPVLPLVLGSQNGTATYVSGSGTAALTFQYTVHTGDAGALALGSTLLLPASGISMKDAAGYPVRVALPSVTAPLGILLDGVAPGQPAITSLAGRRVTGTAEAGSRVDLYLDGTWLANTTADASGAWQTDLPVEVTGSLTVTATDAHGNTSQVSSGTVVDTSHPVVHDLNATVPYGAVAFSLNPVLTGGAATSVAVAGAPAHGTAGASGLALTYTPEPGYAGVDHFTYTASNANGTSDAATVTITVSSDTTGAPVITLSCLADGAATPESLVNVSGLVEAPGGLDSLTVNGVRVTPMTDGRFSYALRLKAGINTVTVVAADKGNRATTTARQITLDLAAPTLRLGQISDGASVTEAHLALAGTIEPAAGDAIATEAHRALADIVPPATGDPIATVLCTLNGGVPQAAVVSGAAFSADLTLAEGLNTLEVVATSASGRVTHVKRSLVLGSVAALAVTDPAEDLVTTEAGYLVKGAVQAGAGLAKLTLVVGGTTYSPQVVDGTFQQWIPLAQAQVWPVVLTVTDAQNRSVSLVRNFAKVGSLAPPTYTLEDAVRVLEIANGLGVATPDDLAKYDLAPRKAGVSQGDGVLNLADAMLVLWLASGQSF